MKKLLTHAAVGILGAFVGLCAGLLIASHVLSTLDASLRNIFCVSLLKELDANNVVAAKGQLQQQIDKNLQVMRDSSPYSFSRLSWWLPGRVDELLKQKVASLQATEEYTKGKPEFLSKTSRQYLDQQTLD